MGTMIRNHEENPIADTLLSIEQSDTGVYPER